MTRAEGEPRGAEPAGSDRLIHQAVARQARERPTAPALVFRGETTTYERLDQAADGCARALREHGVGPGQVVPVLLPRSPRFVAVLLGILKCGAAYTAVDHRWPAPRVASMVRGTDSLLLVADRPVAGVDLPLWRPPDDPSGRPPAAVVDAGSVAAVFFTSGTTGEAKGVLSPHRATTRLFGPGGLEGFGPGRVMPQLAPVPWDGLTLELWGMLTTGGTSVIVDEDYLLPEGLRALVRSHRVDTVWLTSSLFNFFVDEDVDCFAGMRQVLTGGERLSVAYVRRFLDRHPDVALVNGYGPVESCVFVTTHRVVPADCAAPDGIPIGRPVAGTGIHVLGDGGADGGPGEICVSGEGLALGYLGDPAATAERFTTADVDGVPTRVYRTGDLGRLDADGVLHFLGRRDRQVKIAGHRVEPGEIETVALRVPGMAECAVVPAPRPDGASHDRLAMFYTVDPAADRDAGPRLGPAEVRRALSALLPKHLVPHTIRAVRALPRTVNGKADHAALAKLLADPEATAGG